MKCAVCGKSVSVNQWIIKVKKGIVCGHSCWVKERKKGEKK